MRQGLSATSFMVVFVIGFGAIAIVMTEPQYFQWSADGAVDKVRGLIGGTNMAAIHLSETICGSFLLGFISAVAFATILVVVAGLMLAGASAVSHDLYASVVARGRAS